MDTGELYFGQRLQYLREECGMSREQACSSLALNGYNVGVSTLKKWEACEVVEGDAGVISTLSFVYMHPDNNWPVNVNWIYRGVGEPYEATQEELDHDITEDLRQLAAMPATEVVGFSSWGF